MRVLIIKTSSLGDVIHTLPSLTDAASAIDGIQFDWVVEEAFAEVPAWHPLVKEVIPVAIRRWRKNWLKTWQSGEWREFKNVLSRHSYDAVIDAQGLLKSAWLARYTKGPSYGLDRVSAREPLAARFYKSPVNVPHGQHAVERTRQLFAQALGYPLPQQKGRFQLSFGVEKSNEIVLLHGTTWASKHWPELYWQDLAKMAAEAGYKPVLPWGNADERARAERIADACAAEILPKSSLTELASVLANAVGCVGVDSGLGHLAAAVGVPTVSLFGSTSAELTGFYGDNQLPLQADFQCSPCMKRECQFEQNTKDVYPPCFQTLPPREIFNQLVSIMQSRATV